MRPQRLLPRQQHPGYRHHRRLAEFCTSCGDKTHSDRMARGFRYVVNKSIILIRQRGSRYRPWIPTVQVLTKSRVAPHVCASRVRASCTGSADFAHFVAADVVIDSGNVAHSSCHCNPYAPSLSTRTHPCSPYPPAHTPALLTLPHTPLLS